MNFSLILFILVVITGVAWGLDAFWLKKKRAAAGAPSPWWVENGTSLFPIFLIIFLLRSFIAEPFRIPSESMMPTLMDGDFILVNKYTYGVRLPLVDTKVVEMDKPERGDVMVFRYPDPDPENPEENYIKRVIGLPGDLVAYQDKRLFINGDEVELVREENYIHERKNQHSQQFRETLGTNSHRILNDGYMPAYIPDPGDFPGRENCQYNTAGIICRVPSGHYFVMGDNRDNSRDSRFWGFVPEENIVGKAFFIWFNFTWPHLPNLGRIGAFS
ncbi:MAG: signal peptidase I [Zoogloeaceae bacterium]|jgi:signal peptidase I|nr:signal peptidase I [Zoogloeaceae bacterium]